MWLCGFLEILQLITQFKRSEKNQRGTRQCRAEFHFRFIFIYEKQLVLRETCNAGQRREKGGWGGAEAETNEVKAVAYKNSVYRDPQNTQEYDLTGGSPRQRVLQSARRLSHKTSVACTARCDTRIYRQDTH